jgi:hypothetical protein
MTGQEFKDVTFQQLANIQILAEQNVAELREVIKLFLNVRYKLDLIS